MAKKKSTFCTNWQKYALQWGVLALIIFFLSGLGAKVLGLETPDPEKYCPFGGLQALTTFLVKGSLPCSMTTMQIMMGIALAAAVILFSKLFCGYLCPVGTVEDLLKKLREAIGFKSVTIANGSVADKILRIVKYALLFWIVYMTVSASELFCKNLDPYYAAATGFKGEITLWMSLVSLGVVLLLGIVIDRFWCKYVCPLGAVSNSLKYWVWLVLLAGICWALNLLGVHVAWIWYLGAYCLLGYLLEIFHSRLKLLLLGVTINQAQCSHRCYSCRKSCPYGIDVPSHGNKVTSVDCTLCGECVAACPTKALAIGIRPGESEKSRRFTRFLPAIIAVVLVVAAAIAGGKFELPTINETWGTTENMALETVTVKNLRSVKCYGSSMAFKARMEKVRGVHGVKTFVGSHTVVISYDPSVTTADKVQAEVFVPSHFRVESPDPAKYPEIKCVTIRTEHMSDKLDLNYLGIQMRLSGKKIFGLESEYDCPLIVRVYMDPAEQADEEWFRQIVETAALKTIVTTEMARAVAEANGLDCYDTFTGFKFMAEKMNELESAGKNTVIFSYEESYGYMIGHYVRDKDAVTASLLLTEMAAWYHAQGMTLFDALRSLYEKYGWYGEKTHNLVMPGLDGLEKMAALMQSLRAQPPVEIGGVTVAQYKDYSNGTVRDAATGAVTPMPLSGSNVLRFELTDGTHIVVRPSGTEPKIKVYILTKGADAAERDANLEKYSAWVKTLA